MWRITRASSALRVGLILAVLAASGLPGRPSAAQMPRIVPIAGAPIEAVGLTVHEGRLSLRAQNTPLKGIFEALGRQLSIEVMTHIPADERITLAFEQLTLAEALKRLRPYIHYAVVEDATKAPGTIRQLIVFSKRGASGPGHPTTQEHEAWTPPEPRPNHASTPAVPARPQPFRFELDPSMSRGRGR